MLHINVTMSKFQTPRNYNRIFKPKYVNKCNVRTGRHFDIKMNTSRNPRRHFEMLRNNIENEIHRLRRVSYHTNDDVQHQIVSICKKIVAIRNRRLNPYEPMSMEDVDPIFITFGPTKYGLDKSTVVHILYDGIPFQVQVIPRINFDSFPKIDEESGQKCEFRIPFKSSSVINEFVLALQQLELSKRQHCK
jgi:hypothetical protein